MKVVSATGGNQPRVASAVRVPRVDHGAKRRWPTSALCRSSAAGAARGRLECVGAHPDRGAGRTPCPGGGSCSISGIASQTGGATMSCTGVNLGAHTKVYFGIRNDTNVNGNTMTGTAPAAGSAAVFRYSSSTAQLDHLHEHDDDHRRPSTARRSVNNQLVLTLTARTRASVVADRRDPGEQQQRRHRAACSRSPAAAASRSASTCRPAIRSSRSARPVRPSTTRRTHRRRTAGTSARSIVAFYYSDCGDGVSRQPRAVRSRRRQR